MVWERKSLGSLCDILDSLRRPVTKKDRRSGEYPYYGATGIVDYVDEFIFDEPLVLVGEDGAKWGSGERTAFLVSGPCWVNNHAHVLRPMRTKLLDDWLVYYLIHEDLTPFVSGLTVPKLNQGNLREIPVPVPPLSEQRRLVAILDEAFEAIATAKTNTQKNLQNAQQLLALGRDRTFLAIGSGCQRRGLGDVCGFVRGPFGGSLKKEVFVPSGFAVYEQGHAIYGQFDEVRYFIDKTKFKAMQRFELRPGDLIMSCSGTIGKVAIAPTTLRPGIINQALLKLTPGPELRASYLKHWMESADFQDQLRPLSGGAAIQNVASVAVLKGISLPLPTLNAQDEAVTFIARQAEVVDALNEICEAKLAALDELKKSLLHQAFTGALTAKSTDQQLEAVA